MTSVNTKKFEFQIGSNVVKIDGIKKYLNIIVWDEKTTYKDIEKHICKE